MSYKFAERPGYFGRKRDEKIASFNKKYGEGKWRLSWRLNPGEEGLIFVDACKKLYEESYFLHLKNDLNALDNICSFGECIDNASTNVNSGLDYSIQEAFSTHIQDIAIRNVLHRLGRKFTGPKDQILVIRSKDSSGWIYGPGNVPFFKQGLIMQPSLCPKWAYEGSVEDFWQSNKILEVAE